MMKTYPQTLRFIFQKPVSWVIALVGAGLIAWVLFYFTHFALIAGNLGLVFAWTEVVLQGFTAVLFGINLAILWSKLRLAADSKRGATKKAGGLTVFGSVLSVLVSGCPACGITLASYVGLASIVSALPGHGIELQIVGLLILLFSIWYLLRDYGQCKIDTNKKSA